MLLNVPLKLKSKKFFVIFFLICASLVFVGCGGVNSTGESNSTSGFYLDLDAGGIKGTVTASGSSPVKEALVETDTHQATTLEDGSYLLLNLPAGDYKVVARAAGYQPSVQEGVRVRRGVITENIDFVLSQSIATAAKDFEVVSLVPAFGTDNDRISVIARGIGSKRGKVTVAGKDAAIIDWNSGNDGVIVI